MTETHWEVVAEISGELSAEIIRGMLEAQGIPVWLSQEGAGRVYGLTVSTLGSVQVLVPVEHMEAARELLEDYYEGSQAGEERADDSNPEEDFQEE